MERNVLPDVRAGRGAGSSRMPYANIWPVTPRDKVTESMDQAIMEVGEGNDEFVSSVARRGLERGELRSPAFIVLHVKTHTFHHKGQIVAMLRILGYPAPDTDLQQV
jgi:uncharacterized damage-inducible protein DinB